VADPTAAPIPQIPAADAAAATPPGGAVAAATPTDSAAVTATPGEPTSAPTSATAGAAVDAADRAARAQHAAESEALTEQGIQLCRTARWRAAIEPLRRATELDVANAMAFYYLGDAYNHADALSAALEAFEAAARLQPEHWRALKGVGIVLDRMRRPQEAAAAYQRAREAQSKVVSS
jgi:tetratricopeptide (TPR) repeat protein